MRVKRILFGSLLAGTWLLLFLIGCDNSFTDMREGDTYRPSTETGQVFYNVAKITTSYAGRSIEVLNNYVDMEEIARSADDGIIDSPALLAGLSGNETRVIRGRNGIEQTVTLKEELKDMAADMKEEFAANAPDVTPLVDLPGIEAGPTPNSIVIEGDQVVDGSTPSGAMTISFLKAQANGEDMDAVSRDMEKTAASIGLEAGRGFYLSNFARWSKKKIVYRFNNVSSDTKKIVRDAARDWDAKTEVSFRETTSGAEAFFAKIFFFFGLNVLEIFEHGGNYRANANVGAVAWPKMNLSSTGPERWRKTTARHELGHVIGLKHEHQRPDRNQYISGNFSGDDGSLNIINPRIYYPVLVWLPTTIRFLFFRIRIYLPWILIRSSRTARTSSTYDYFSIMHYPYNYNPEADKTYHWRALKEQTAYIGGRKYTVKVGDYPWKDDYRWYGQISPIDAETVNRMY